MATMTVIGVIFLVVLGVLWCILPFAVFGTQPKLANLIREIKVTNKLLAEISASLKK